ncbi:MAG: hypothetical protein J7M18_03360 [Candidatus Eremiobacteraeota bacterium]|nr:hypothetical protein [Candidatus Eremiobacteraeota bacterium]
MKRFAGFVLCVILVFFLLSVQAVAENIAEVKLGGVLLMRIRGAPDAGARADTIENRIKKGIEKGLDPGKVRVEEHYHSADIMWEDMRICTIDRRLAKANRSDPAGLAKKIAWRLKTTLKGGMLTLTPDELVMPVGGKQTVRVGGFLKKGLKLISASQVVRVSLAEDGGSMGIEAISPGRGMVIVARGPFRAKMKVIVKEWAGTMNKSTETWITGNPVPIDVIERAALAAAAEACKVKPGAGITLAGDVGIFDSSLEQQEMLARVPLEIKGRGYFTLNGTISVNIKNKKIEIVPPTTLMVSNRPEEIKENGILISGSLDRENPIRLLYSHKNGGEKTRIIWVSLENPGDEPARALVIPATAGPSPYEMAVGIRSVQRFLECLAGKAGYIVNLPVKSSITLSEQWLSKGDVVGGFFQVQALQGDDLTLKVTTTEVGAQEDILGMIPPRFDPFRVHPHGIFSGPDFILEGELRFPDGEADFEIGGEPYLLDDESGQPNLGNYGSLYQINITMDNPDDKEHVLELYFEPLNGISQACFMISGRIYNIGMTRPGARICWYRESIPPGTKKEMTIYTMPQPGSYYPVKLTARYSNSGGGAF